MAYANQCTSFPNVTNNASIFKGIENIKVAHRCTNLPVRPRITIQNTGSENLTSAKIKIELDGNVSYANWTGNLNKWATNVFTLPDLNLPDGIYNYTLTIEEANGKPVTPAQNKASKTIYKANKPLDSNLNESFSQNFPPVGWENSNAEYLRIYPWTGNNYAVLFTSVGNLIVPNGGTAELILPLLNFSSNSAPFIQFDRAHAKFNGVSDNRLEVYIATNCGTNWGTPVYKKSGNDLVTATVPNGYDFLPKDASEWRTDTLMLPTLAYQENVSIKFRFFNGLGNYMWLDNVKVGDLNSTSIEEYSANTSVQLYPNPVTDELYIKSDKPVQSVQIYNIQGQMVASGSENTHSISMSRLSNGLYIVKTMVNDEIHITKIVKQQ